MKRRRPLTAALHSAVALGALALGMVGAGGLGSASLGFGASPAHASPGAETAAAAHPGSTGSPEAVPSPASSDTDDFLFSRLDVDYTIGRSDDGTSTLTVVEAFTAQFPQTDQNHGMRRSIPTTYNGQPVNPHLVSVTDEDGSERPVDTETEDGTFTMTSRADHYLHGSQTFVFTYTLENVTWDFPETGTEEFYWDVGGVDWEQPFGAVDVTLHVPAELAGALTGEQSCYRGAQGATDSCPISATSSADGAEVITARAGTLDPHETMTVAVGFTPGTFQMYDTSFYGHPWGWLQTGAVLAALAMIIPAALTRRRRLRDAPGRPTIIAEYEPPAGIDALHAAVFRSAPAKAIPALVLEQAVAGSIRILEGRRKLLGPPRMRAQLVDRDAAGTGGTLLLNALFGAAGPGAMYEFGRTDRRFTSAAQKIRAWAKGSLVRRGLWRPVRVRSIITAPLLGVLFALVAIGCGIASLVLHLNPALPVIGLAVALVAAAACVVLVSHRPLSPAGAELRDHLAGLDMFIGVAEADRIRMLQSPEGAERVRVDPDDPRQMLHLYETLLPFAVVFGHEKEWANELTALYERAGYDAPGWYQGSTAFNAAAFSSGVAALSASASSSSTTSGGAGGGGAAGGGGGGGGGGGV